MKRSRRAFSTDFARATAATALLGASRIAVAATAAASARIIVVGGGFAGATCARRIKAMAPEAAVTLIDPSKTVVTCPFSNAVIADLLPMSFIAHERNAPGVQQVLDHVTSIDLTGRTVRVSRGEQHRYDRLVLAPGIELDFAGIDGYSPEAAEVLPHAWLAGPQTELLRRQVQQLPEGGVFAMSIPDNPYRCPPGPYERASLVAWYLKKHNSRAKVLLLDAKDDFTKRALFQQAWQGLYPGMIEWLGRSDSGTVSRIDAKKMSLHTDFDTHTAQVINVIPPQRAPAFVRAAGLDGGRGWCNVNARSFESDVAPGVHLIGDVINAAPMPKSAFAAHTQALACASAVVAMLAERDLDAPVLMNTCYSLVAPNYGISITGAYRELDGTWQTIDGSAGTSDLQANAATREAEAAYAHDWYRSIVRQAFGA